MRKYDEITMTTHSGLTLQFTQVNLVFSAFVQVSVLKLILWWRVSPRNSKNSKRVLELITEPFEKSYAIPDYPSFIPQLYVITPTYERVTQFSDLVNVVQAIASSHVPTQLIIVEDTNFQFCSPAVNHLKDLYNYPKFLLNFTLLTQGSPVNKHELRGWKQRNRALNWTTEYATSESENSNKSAIVYFADDDNTYNSDMFKAFTQIGKLNKNHVVGMLPIAGIKNDGWNNTGIHGNPFQCWNNSVVQIHTKFENNRYFPVDMANFAFRLDTLLERGLKARFNSVRNGLIAQGGIRKGWLETCFLSNLLDVDCYKPLKDKSDRMHDSRRVFVRGWSTLPRDVKDKVQSWCAN